MLGFVCIVHSVFTRRCTKYAFRSRTLRHPMTRGPPRTSVNATAFYMYTHPALDHSWLRNCEGFAALRHSVNDSNTAEVGVHRLLRRQSARQHGPCTHRTRGFSMCPSLSTRRTQSVSAMAPRTAVVWKSYGGGKGRAASFASVQAEQRRRPLLCDECLEHTGNPGCAACAYSTAEYLAHVRYRWPIQGVRALFIDGRVRGWFMYI
jgi:hypothetical protein